MSAYMPSADTFLAFRWNRVTPATRWMLGSAVATGGLVAWLVSPAMLGSSPVPRAVLAASAGARAVIGMRPVRVELRQGYVTLTGEIQNLSHRSLKDVEAVVEVLDPRGDVIRVEAALIAVGILQPGEASPFTVTAQADGATGDCRLRFRRLLGDDLPARSLTSQDVSKL